MDTTLDKYLPVRRSGQSQVKNQKQSSVHVPANETSLSDRSSGEEEELALLRAFDLNSTFGPTIGISRLDRWMRAQKFGLSPPSDILLIINQHPEDQRFTECLWKALE
ncbi:hypothetical protein EMCRGX_G024517 [Ephydatia muelleri]